jgi:outer membrane protein
MRGTFVALSVAIVMTAGQALAAPAVKIGVVDLQRAVAECKEGIAARAQLLKKTEEFNAELKLLMADFEKSKAELEKDAARLAADARAEKEKQLQKKGRDFQNRQREAQDEVKQLESDYLKKVVNHLGVILGKIGDEGNFTVVLDKNSGVFYAGKEVDLTPLLVKRADEELKK